ncbi:LysR family transcriptional regulator [Microbacterium sp. SZ1]|uniref:LysR family transcriptional regulator n=1 Tax=Microbacterium sp. SZ1 TaxID=1849736 RepID=UPI000BBC12BF|nr:LysR family transcriptional regulator [Microbacterium sp. SZ1]PCE13636.1 LysR family transcriptional regulator [Microbacterium sp. SZ1]
MDLQQMRYVVALAEESSFTRAAEKSFVTQSALSHQIAALEREIGHRLFVRTSRAVRLTEPGEAFLAHARIAVRASSDAREAASAAAGNITGTLRLGVIPTVTAVEVPTVIARFRSMHPNTRVELVVGNSDSLMSDVRAGRLDAALLGLRAEIEPHGVAASELAREKLVAVVPDDHRLANRRSIRLSDLADEVFADFPAGTSGRAQSDAAFADADVPRDVAFEADSAELILGLVAAGLAVTLLAAGVPDRSRGGVRIIPLRDGPSRVEYLAWDERSTRAVTRAFREVIGGEPPGNAEAGPEESSEPAPSAS